MKFLFLESFYSGSHALFADGLKEAVYHDIDLMTMPGENWRWRMLGAALYFAERMPDLSGYDGLIATDLLNLPDLMARMLPNRSPVMAYFHENQLTYPQPPGDKKVAQTGTINIATALAADRVAFNSRFHMDAFIEAAGKFLDKMPDCRPGRIQETIQKKALVLYPGVEPSPVQATLPKNSHGPPLIIWNHRWAYDKNYEAFFDALDAVAAQGLNFRLALLGENFGRVPQPFEDAKNRFADRIVQSGYVKSRRQYRQWLSHGDIVISTTNQENFGIAVIEAVLSGCIPLVPARLSYPEIIPSAFHDQCLYTDPRDLIDKLGRLISAPDKRRRMAGPLKDAMQSFLWKNRVSAFDEILETLAKQQPAGI